MTFPLTRLIVLVAAILVTAGWILSAAGQLNAVGYIAVFLIAAPLVWFELAGQLPSRKPSRLRAAARRCRRPFAAAFVILATLTLLGGLLYAPGNYDALAYRIPRTLHWLADGHWRWIHTEFPRMNTRAQGCEWMMAPALLFLHSERIMWFPNFLMLLTMPGLLFTTLRAAGVSRRVAWQWMWILPCSYGLLLQAGGMSNDLPGAFFAIGAVALALHARSSGRISDLWLSMLSAALASGVKASNAPLALLWVIAAWPAVALARRHISATALVALASLLCSFLPGAILNVIHCGDWSGARLEVGDPKALPPAALIAGNTLSLAVQNLAPPILPVAARWNAVMPQLLPPAYHRHVARYFELETGNLTLGEIQMEESAGLGCTATLLLLIAFSVAIASPRETRPRNFQILALRWAPWLLLLFCLTKLNLVAVARLCIPYYPLIAAAVLAGRGQEWLSRRRWWHALAMVHFASAALLVVISPPRPLWPALTVIDSLYPSHPESRLLKRLHTVYTNYRNRPDVMAPVRRALPPEAKVVGLVTFDDVEASLWRPYGTRRFLHVTREDTRADLEKHSIRWIVISFDIFAREMNEPLDSWLARMNADLVNTVPIEARGSRGVMDWYIAKLRNSTNPP